MAPMIGGDIRVPPGRSPASQLKDLSRCLMQAFAGAVLFNEVKLGVVHEHPFIQDPGVNDNGHVLLNVHRFVVAD